MTDPEVQALRARAEVTKHTDLVAICNEALTNAGGWQQLARMLLPMSPDRPTTMSWAEWAKRVRAQAAALNKGAAK
jgi:hypothetical protein